MGHGTQIGMDTATGPARAADSAIAAQRMQVLGMLASGVAHDFNNLLTSMIGTSELVLARQDLAPELAEDMARLRRNAEHGAALVRQILQFGRPGICLPGLVKLLPRIEAALRLARPGPRIRVEIAVAAELQVRIDPVQLDQVLVNLIVNACNAMPQGGLLHLSAQDNAGHAVLMVSDTGSGIPDAILPRIFDPFFTTRADAGGTGLGLSTVRDILARHGGQIVAESPAAAGAGQGACFTLRLPAV